MTANNKENADMSEINRKLTADNQKGAKEHELSLTQRGRLCVSGVVDVTSFDQDGAELETVLGRLSVEGSGLKLDMLDTESGSVEINGRIDAISYSDADTTEKKGIFKRLLGC